VCCPSNSNNETPSATSGFGVSRRKKGKRGLVAGRGERLRRRPRDREKKTRCFVANQEGEETQHQEKEKGEERSRGLTNESGARKSGNFVPQHGDQGKKNRVRRSFPQ